MSKGVINGEEVGEFFNFPKLHPFQKLFATTRARCPLNLGGMGSGKSLSLVIRTIFLCIDTPYFGNLSGNLGIMGRFSRTDLENTTMRDFFEFVPDHWIKSFDKQKFVLTLKNESVIIFVPLEELRRFRSMNIGFAAFEQIEETPEEVFNEIEIHRMRRVKTLLGGDVAFRSAFGIANSTMNWVFNKWGLNEEKLLSRDVEERGSYDPNFPVIHSSVYDNAENLPPDYIPNMEKRYGGKDSPKGRMFMMGLWGTLEGNTFYRWSEDLVLSEDWWPPLDVKVIVGVDHGETTGSTAFVFIALYKEGVRDIVHLIDEVYLSKGEEFNDGIDIATAVERVDEALQFHAIKRSEASLLPYVEILREKISSWPCDPAMFRHLTRTSPEDEPLTVADIYRVRALERGFGLNLVASNNSIDVGVDRLNWLMGSSLLRINPRCKNTISDLRNCVNGDDGKPKKKQKDHGAAATRYGVMSIPMMNLLKRDKEKTTKAQEILKKVRHVKSEELINVGALV